MFKNLIRKMGGDESPDKEAKLALKDLKKVLTADQYNKLMALEKEKRASRDSRSGLVHKEAHMLRDGSPDAVRVSLLAKSITERQV